MEPPTRSRLPDASLEGSDVGAVDGEIGTVQHASGDRDRSYLLIAVGGRISGTPRVVPAGAVRQIDVDARKVLLRAERSAVEDAPDPPDENWQDDPAMRDRLATPFVASPT